MSDDAVSRQAIASRLRLARQMAGLTQGQVAIKFGWNRPTVSEVEAGRRRVSAEEIPKFAQLYGVNVPWIVGETEGSQSVNDRVRLAARELSKLKGNDLDRLLELIQALKTSKDP